MKKTSQVFAVVLIAAILISCSACGEYRSSMEEIPVEQYGQSTYALYDSAASKVSGNGLAAPEKARIMNDFEEAEVEAPLPDPGAENSEPGENPEKIIYSANATVETTKFDETIEALDNMIKQYDGWVESSSNSASSYKNIQRGTESNRTASYTIRIPGERFNTMINSLSSLGHVPYSNVYTENVTSQYYDTAARLRNYEAQEQRLIELLDMAETVSDVIEIENELTDVRYRIESLQTQLNGWDRRISYSTIYLNINEVTEYTPEKNISYGKKLINALKNGVENLGYFFIDLAEALPVLIVLAAIIWAITAAIKRIISSVKKKNKDRKPYGQQKHGKQPWNKGQDKISGSLQKENRPDQKQNPDQKGNGSGKKPSFDQNKNSIEQKSYSGQKKNNSEQRQQKSEQKQTLPKKAADTGKISKKKETD